jgi:sigma-54 dependent transcriptional regulator, acetoin dehydrogenase operon transcriptional activator AcoR
MLRQNESMQSVACKFVTYALLNLIKHNDLGTTLCTQSVAPKFSKCNTISSINLTHNQAMTELQSNHRLDRLSRIAHARQAVMQGGPNAAAQYVQPWIAQSWQRCLQAGHRPEDRLGFDMVTNATQRRSLEANHVLRQAARSTLDQLSIAIAQTRYFAILTSASGEVIDTGGAIDRSDRRADLITRVGVDLSELAVGTTAIGLTLQEQRSTWLHRGEHFYQDTQWYSCAGAPITGPDGHCVGMVDVTGIEVAERPALAHLVATSARAIENALVLSRPHTLVLHLQWPGQHCGKDSEGLVCVDADGVIGAMNPMARQMLGLLQPAPASLHLSDVFAISCGSIFDAQHSAGWMAVPLWSGLHLEARTSSAGTLAPKSLGGSTLPAWSTPVQALKEHENALIKQTVTKLRGNVAAAAEQLGISRSTIYRKLGKPRR